MPLLGLILGAILIIVVYIIGTLISIAKASDYPLWLRILIIVLIVIYILLI